MSVSYKGVVFQSEMHARWAAFFDAMGFIWEYRQQSLDLPSGKHTPDFWIPLPGFTDLPGAGYWLEISRVKPTHGQAQTMLELAATTGHHVHFLSGPMDADMSVWNAICLRSQESIDKATSEIGSPAYIETEYGDKVPQRPPLKVTQTGNSRGAALHSDSDFAFAGLVHTIGCAMNDNRSTESAFAAARSVKFESL